MHSHNAHYYDLGIMHQTTFNTYKAMTTGDLTRFLEMTNTLGPQQIKRMAIHNDLILALIAPLYVIYSGPEMLLVVQSAALALGAFGLYLLTNAVIKTQFKSTVSAGGSWLALSIAVSYLLYPMLHYTNLFEFHGVALATTFLIFMFYFWYIGRYKISFLFALLSMLTKEQVALTVLFFCLYVVFSSCKDLFIKKKFTWKTTLPYLRFPVVLGLLALTYFIVSLEVIIPFFRGGTDHFALEYYGEFGDSPTGVISAIVRNPSLIFKYVLNEDAIRYLVQLFQPVGFLAILSPFVLAIAAPEFGVNLLSQSDNMRNIIFHYTAVLTPFIFIATIFTAVTGVRLYQSRFNKKFAFSIAAGIILVFALYSTYTTGALPGARTAQVYMYRGGPANSTAVYEWSQKLKDDSIRVATTGKLAPFFTSRRYYYVMSKYYTYADYVVVNPEEVYKSFGSQWAIPGYEALVKDPQYKLLYKEDQFEVYAKQDLVK